jgi:hypothetical protein
MKVLVLALLLLSTTGLTSQETRQPVVFSIPPQPFHFTVGEPASQTVITGYVALTITSANTDDSLTGKLTVTFPAEEKKAGKTSDSPQALSLAPFVLENVKVSFRKGTACPLIRVSVDPIESSTNGTQIRSKKLSIEIRESRDEVSQLLCFWTKQINSSGLRKGIIARINRLLSGDDPQ